MTFELGLSTIVGMVAAQITAGLGYLATAAESVPEWAKYLMGPFGGLVGTMVAVWWLAKRLNKVEENASKQRQSDMELMINQMRVQTEALTKCAVVMDNNTRCLERVEKKL